MNLPTTKTFLAALLATCCALAAPLPAAAQEETGSALDCMLEILNYKERLEACATALDEAASDDRRSLILSSRAGLFAQQGEFDRARSDLSASLVLDPGNADAWIRASALSLRMELPVEALAQASMAVGLSPEDSSAYLHRALALSAIDPQRCVEDASSAIELAMASTTRPEDLPQGIRAMAIGSQVRGDCLAAAGDPGMAIDDLLAARALDPQRLVGASLVHAYVATGDTDAAMAEVERLEEDAPDARTGYLRFVVLDAAGERKAALREIAALHKAEPDDIAIANDYAWTLFLEGDTARAAEVIDPFFSSRARIGSVTSPVADTYAHILAAEGDAEAARSMFRLAVRLADTAQLETYAEALERVGFAPGAVSRAEVGKAVDACVVELGDGCRLFEE